MFNKNNRILFTAILMLITIFGCTNVPIHKSVSEPDPFYALQELMVAEKVTDARYQRIDGYDYFLVNLPLRYQLNHFQNLSSLQGKKKFVTDILKESRQVGEEAMALYLARISQEKLNQFIMAQADLEINANKLFETYQQRALRAEAEEVERVQNISTVDELDQYWGSFVDSIEESIMTKGRIARELETFFAVPFIKGWIAYHEATDDRGAIKPDFKNIEVYALSLNEKASGDISTNDWTLLQHFAPLIVHEVDPDAHYAIENDRFGAVYLTGRNYDDITVHVDTTKPTIYAYIDQKNIQGVNVKQLVYTFFHPSHPQLSKLDPEAGAFDGWTIRVTLDQHNQPLDFESVSNCGCYYKNFPTDRLESLASRAFPEKLEDKQFYIENSVAGKFDAIIPELVTDIDATQDSSVVIYVSAGHHQLITIRSKQHAELLNKPAKTYQYQLRHYDELESLSFSDRYASLFDSDGLVRNAHRPECILLKPSGLYHAGHPRQRETQMIYFDEAQFDDPGLLETYLRLPPNVFGLQE